MRVALSAWFAGRAVGSGQYTDSLLAALRDAAGPDEDYQLLSPPLPASGTLTKLRWEQRGFPRASRAFDLAHVPYWAPPLRPNTPTVVTVHDLIPLILPAYRRRASVRLYTHMVARASRGAAALLADSEHTARDMLRRLDIEPARVHVIPLGVDARFQPASDSAIADLRAALDLPPRFGLYLGGFDQRKNLLTLLLAWRRVYRNTGLPLVIAGRLPQRGDALHPHPFDLARQAELPDSALRFAGFIADVDLPTLYAAAAVFAFPSRYEGFGLGPLEAMACGTPVVAADATSLPEVVGEAGRLISPDAPQAWAEALIEVLEDAAQAAALAAAGLARARRFTWARTAASTREVYRRLAAGR